MLEKKPLGSPDTAHPDDAPELTVEMLDRAEVFEGDRFVRRGRPRSVSPKESISIRLDADILAALRRSGPGWQSRLNDILRRHLAEQPLHT